MQFYVSVITKEGQLAVVIRQNLHLDHLSVYTSLNFESKFTGLKDFDSGWVDARRDNIATIR